MPSGRDSRAGVTLIETMFALVLVAMVAGLALPFTLPGRGAAAVEGEALRLVALLRADRNAALRSGRVVATAVDLGARRVDSGAGPGRIALPRTLALSYDGAPGRIEFRPDGTSTGAALGLSAAGTTVAVLVSPYSGAVTLASR